MMPAVTVATTDALTVGRHYFVRQDRRVDPFRHKRYCDPSLQRWESLVVMGRLVEERGGEVKLLLEGNHGFERDGGEYVFPRGSLLCAPGGGTRSLEEHGKPDLALGRWA